MFGSDFLELALISAVVCAVIGAAVAPRNGWTAGEGAIWGFFLGWIGLIIVLVAKGSHATQADLNREAWTGWRREGRFIAAWSWVSGVQSGMTVGIALSSRDLAVVNEAGFSLVQMPLREVDLEVEVGTGLRVRRDKDNVVVLRPIDGTNLKQVINALPVAAPGPTPASDVPDQIKKLGELRDAGMLTSDEFEAKKKELLSRM